MKGRWTVREAELCDAEAIAHVHVDTWRTVYRGQVPDEVLGGLSVSSRAGAWREVLGGEARPGQRTWVAEGDDSIVGFANAGPSRDPDADARTGEVYAIYVLPAYWDSGAGAALMERALQHLRSGFAEATLWVLETNERGRRFYEKGGWRADGASQPLEGLGGAIELRYRIDLSV